MTSPPPTPKRHFRAWPTVVGVALAVSPILVLAWWLPGHLATRRGFECREHLRQIGIALHAYHEQYHSFPPAYVDGPDGTRLHSWRVLLLPFLGHDDLYQQYDFNEPWNGPHNVTLASKIPAVYACPAARKHELGVTNYLAIVGRATLWPEQHAARLDDFVRKTKEFYDAPDSTIQVIESGTSDVVWLEPRDITHREALARDPSGNAQILMTTEHPSGGTTNALFGDGSLVVLHRTMLPELFDSLLTMNSGLPLPGVEWPPESDPARSALPPPRPATAFPSTDVFPYPTGPVVPGRNYVYCATFELAWDEQRRQLKQDPLRVSGDPPLATLLNQRRFDPRNLSADAYVARGGPGTAKFRNELREELAAKFPGIAPRLIGEQTDDSALFVYAFLRKALPFKAEFDTLPDPISFQEQDRSVPVSGFGVEHLDDYDARGEQLQSQVTILDYVNDDDFVLRLSPAPAAPAHAPDEIILAKIKPAATLAETVDLVRRRAGDAGRDPKAPQPGRNLEPARDPKAARFHRNETLAVPKLEISIERQYTELQGRDIPGSSLHFELPLQVIQFRLDEAGALLVSEVAIPSNNGGPPPSPLGKRKFIFDRPFLVYLIERDADEPYFAAWIENTELMLPQEQRREGP